MLDFLFNDDDFDGTIRSEGVTAIAEKKIHAVVHSDDFAGRDAIDIERFLLTEMKIIPFGLYLKRYIYLVVEFEERFSAIPDEVYQQIIMDSFDQHRAPHSFEPTTVRWKTLVNRWLTQDSVQRGTIFLLGFGLGMNASSVSEFLTKVIGESDIDFNDPWEVICWYCFKKGLPYADAVSFKERFETMSGHFEGTVTEESLQAEPTDEKLMAWLSWLKQAEGRTNRRAARTAVFQQLYRDCQSVIAQINEESEWGDAEGRSWNASDITSADIEKYLCEGIPKTKSGNLQKSSDSALSRQFRNKRVSRQRLDSLLKGELEVTRFDIISLQFLISSQNFDDDPADRCRYFADDVNDLLEQCGMRALYPANPYEAFVLMCLLKDGETDPLEAYSQVWKASYEEE